jgi:hypothetical protein
MNIVKARKMMAEKFLADLDLRNNFESLILMVQLTYLQELWFTVNETKPKCGFQHMFGKIYSHMCQKAFLDKLVEVIIDDRQVILIYISLRSWWNSYCSQWDCDWEEFGYKENPQLDWLENNKLKREFLEQNGNLCGQELCTKMYGYQPNDVCLKAVNFLLQKEQQCNSVQGYPRSYISEVAELRTKHKFAVSFDWGIQSFAVKNMVNKLKTFESVRLLYGCGQHTGNIGVVLLKLACKLATTKEDLILVTRWLLNSKREETKCLQKHLKPLLKKLIATL